MNFSLKETTIGAVNSIFDSQQIRYIRGGITLDASQVSADGNGLKKLSAGTFVGKLGTKYAKYVAAVAAALSTGVIGSNNAITWTAKIKGSDGNDINIELAHPGVAGSVLDVQTVANTIKVLLATGAADYATLATGVVGNNNAITWTAKVAGADGNDITITLSDPGTPSAALSVSVAGDDITVSLATDAGTASTLDTGIVGNNNAITWTAATVGVDGDNITITLVDPGAASAALAVGVVGNDITVNLATDAGTASSGTSGVEGNNNGLTWTAQSVGTDGDDISVTLEDPDDVGQALSVDVAGTAIIVSLATDAGGAITSTAAQVKAAIEAEASAAALVAVDHTGASTGAAAVTDEAVLLAGGAEPAVSSTAAQVIAAITNDVTAAALITAANTGASNGGGVVAAVAETNLAGGVDPAITSTAAQVITAIKAHGAASDLVGVANTGASTGAGAVVAVGQTNLAGGDSAPIASTAAQVIEAVNKDFDAKDVVVASNTGASTGVGVVAVAAATPLAGGSAASVTPTLILPDDVTFTQFTPSSGAAHYDQVVTAVDGGRVIVARLPEAPDAVVKANMPGIAWRE